MAQLTIHNYRKVLASATITPLYIVYGEEQYFHDDFLQQLQIRLFGEQCAGKLNVSVFYGTEDSFAEILNACMSYSLFAENKLVVVRQFDKLKLDNKDALIKYAENPQPGTTLVLLAEKWGTTKFHKALASHATLLQCYKLFESDIFAWAQNRFNEAGLKVEKDALRFLVENIGSNILRLNLEVDKIISFAGDRKVLSQNDIADLTGFNREISVFALQKMLAARNLERSLRIGLRLLEQGENLAAVLPILFTFFRRMWLVKELQNRGFNQKKILNELGGKQFVYKDIFATVSNFSVEHIKATIEKIEQCEFQLKTSQQQMESILTLLCYFICKK